MNFKHHLWPRTGEIAIASDWQVYTDTLRYLHRNFPAGTNGNNPIFFFSFHWMLKVVEVPTHAHPDMPSICQHYSDPCILYIFHTCFPNLTFKPYFSSIVNDDVFLYVTKSNDSHTSNDIYIYTYCFSMFFFETGANLTWHVDVNSHQYFLQISKNQFWSSKIVYVRIQRFVIMFHINIAILGVYCIFRHIQILSTASTSNFQTTSTLWQTNIAMDNHHL